MSDRSTVAVWQCFQLGEPITDAELDALHEKLKETLDLSRMFDLGNATNYYLANKLSQVATLHSFRRKPDHTLAQT